MGNLTVKESGEMVNIISPNVNKITSFKVHFSPKQEGIGEPSPDNVREIVGWNGVKGYISNVAQSYSSTSNTLTAVIDWTEDVGTIYGGYVDLVTGEIYKNYEQVIFDGTIRWSGITNYDNTNRFIYIKESLPLLPQNNAICYFNYLTNRSGSGQIGNGFIGSTGNVLIYTDKNINSIDSLMEYQTNNPLQLIYKLETPILVATLSPTQLSTLKGQNNFWSNADYVEIEYELTETFDIQKAKRKIILSQPHVETASGNIVTFDTDMRGKLKECKVYFSPVQEGEGNPSPENVRNIVGWNGVSVYSPSENLIPNDIPAQFYHVSPSASDGHFIKSGTAHSTFIIPIPKGKICLARTTRDFLSYGALCDEPPTVGSNAFNVITMTNRNYKIFDNSDGHKYFAITTNRTVEVNSDWSSFLSTEPRLTIGDVAQPYTAPTNISTYSVDWTDSAGTVYGGYVDLVSGELVQTWYGFVLDGVNNYLNSGSKLLNNGLVTIFDYIGSGGLNNLPRGPYNAYTGAIICNKFPLTYNTNNEGIATGSGTLYIRLMLDPSKLEDVSSTSAIKESMIKWQQENPLQIVYKLGTPIHYQLTSQQILTLKGTNNVYSNTNGQTEIKYWKH